MNSPTQGASALTEPQPAGASDAGQSVRFGEILVGWSQIGTVQATSTPLGPTDSARLAEMPAAQQARFLHGRTLLHRLLQQLQPGSAPQLDGTLCPHCGTGHGPVSVTNTGANSVVTSLSYAEGLVVAAVAPATQVAAVGVDVERDRAKAGREHTNNIGRLSELTALIGGEPESALRRWTKIEAVLKADGRGLRVAPDQVRLNANTAQINNDSARYLLTEIDGPASYLISLAWR